MFSCGTWYCCYRYHFFPPFEHTPLGLYIFHSGHYLLLDKKINQPLCPPQIKGWDGRETDCFRIAHISRFHHPLYPPYIFTILHRDKYILLFIYIQHPIPFDSAIISLPISRVYIINQSKININKTNRTQIFFSVGLEQEIIAFVVQYCSNFGGNRADRFQFGIVRMCETKRRRGVGGYRERKQLWISNCNLTGCLIIIGQSGILYNWNK